MRDDDGDRPRPGRHGGAEGRADNLRQGRHRRHKPGILGDGLEELELIKALTGNAFFLQRQPVERQLADDADHRDRRIQSLQKAGRQQVGAGADRYVTDTGLAGQPGIGIRRIGGIALITHQHVADAVRPAGDAVMQCRGLATGHAEHQFDPVLCQHFRYQVANMRHCPVHSSEKTGGMRRRQ